MPFKSHIDGETNLVVHAAVGTLRGIAQRAEAE